MQRCCFNSQMKLSLSRDKLHKRVLEIIVRKLKSQITSNCSFVVWMLSLMRFAGWPRYLIRIDPGRQLPRHQGPPRRYVQNGGQHDQGKDPGGDSKDVQHQERFHSLRRGTSQKRERMVRRKVRQIQSPKIIMHFLISKQIWIFLSLFWCPLD